MTSSELYHGFALDGYRTMKTSFISGKIILDVASTRAPKCAACNSVNVIGRGTFVREFKAPPLGEKQVIIRLRGQRVACRDCHAVRRVDIGFAAPRRGYIKRLEKYVLSLLRHATMKDVARLVGLGWDAVKDIQKRYLTKRHRRPRLKGVTRVAIDEISIGKHHRYLTVVLDLDSGKVLFVGDGKGADALKPFWNRVKRCKQCRIRSVAIDMSRAYISAVSDNLPESRIVFDRFHIVKLCNEMLTKLRRALYNEATELMHMNVLKGTRWLLLKNPENLDASRDEGKRLKAALKLNQPLAAAYYMKEDLRQFWEQGDKCSAGKFLSDWMRRAEASGIKKLKDFAHTVAAHRQGILAWYDDRISTGPLEGTNNKIKTMKRQAYGFRDTEFLKLKIMALHETKYALIG
jgi:transposase